MTLVQQDLDLSTVSAGETLDYEELAWSVTEKSNPVRNLSNYYGNETRTKNHSNGAGYIYFVFIVLVRSRPCGSHSLTI